MHEKSAARFEVPNDKSETAHKHVTKHINLFINILRSFLKVFCQELTVIKKVCEH